MAGTSLAILSIEPDIGASLEASDTLADAFGAFTVIHVAPGPGDGNRAMVEAWADAIARAAVRSDWLFLLAPSERINPAALTQALPMLEAYDAIWGGIAIGGSGEVPRLARYTGHGPLDAAHSALNWWIGRSHFISAAVLRDSADHGCAPDALAAAIAEVGHGTSGQGAFGRYLMAQWRKHRCLKTAQPFTSADALPEPSPTDLAEIKCSLHGDPLFMRFQCHGHDVALPYTGCNPTLERVQMRGIFYEQRDLEALLPLVPCGTVMIDVGANTGNHTLFFARVLGASLVVPVEPNADAIHALRQMIEANRLTNVDLSWLGYGVGGQPGRASLSTGRRGNLGSAKLAADADGDTPVVTLDEILKRYRGTPVGLIKIDVEANELDVLAGATETLATLRPRILIEVMDDNIVRFHAIMSSFGYAVAAVFADTGYANYILVPSEQLGDGMVQGANEDAGWRSDRRGVQHSAPRFRGRNA